MKFQNLILPIILIIVILAAMFAVAAPALAVTGSCTQNSQLGWHIVGGGQNSDHWYPTETECLIALQVPTALATLQATSAVTEQPTAVPTDITDTPVPTETATEPPTVVPTDTITSTPVPTDPAVTPTPVITYTPFPTPTETQPKRILGCYGHWEELKTLVYKDEAYRYFDKRPWCQTWLYLRYGIDYNQYKLTHP